jgi:replication factor A1
VLTITIRYIISLAVADWSGQAWLQGFNDAGLAVFGMPANDIVEVKVSYLLMIMS